MLLRNYYKAVSACMEGTGTSTKVAYISYNGDEVYSGFYKNGVNCLTPTKTGDSYTASMSRIATTPATSLSGIILGTGDTPPTVDDHRLAGDIITTIASSVAVSFEMEEGGTILTSLCTITNSGSDPITIREVGLFGKGKSSNYDSDAVLVERTVLDSPLTIEPGSVGQLTYTIKLNYPT